MTTKSSTRQKAAGSGFTIGVTYFGYFMVLFGLLSAVNWIFDLAITWKGWTFPADWKIALFFALSGGVFSFLGHFMETGTYQRLVAKQWWIPWVIWTFLPLFCLVAIFWAVGIL